MKRGSDRRQIERREAKPGVTTRHDDKADVEPRRVRWGRQQREDDARVKNTHHK